MLGAPAPRYDQILRQFKGERGLFVQDILENEVGGSFDPWPIQKLCDEKTWTPGLVISCEPSMGGIGHVRNAQLNCIRLAIEVGGEVILPGIVKRNTNDITKLNKVADPKGPLRGEPLDYLFDKQYLIQSLETSCPQLKVYQSLNDLVDQPSVQSPLKLDLENFPVAKEPGGTLTDPSTWGTSFYGWLNQTKPVEQRKYPMRVHMSVSNFYWPAQSDGPAFAKQFGRVMRPREDARRLAAVAIYEMNRRFKWGWEPRRDAILKDTYVGVHLRTEADAVERFPEYAVQGADYLNYASNTNLSVIFLAYGDTAKNVDQFTLRAQDFQIEVISKSDLLSGDELRYLKNMSWDQRGLVDFEILTRSAYQTGPAASTFSFNIALRRNTMAADYSEEETSTDSVMETEADQRSGRARWIDEYSILYGTDSPAVRAAVVGIWP